MRVATKRRWRLAWSQRAWRDRSRACTPSWNGELSAGPRRAPAACLVRAPDAVGACRTKGRRWPAVAIPLVMRIPDTSLATIKVCGARVMLCAMAMLFYELFPRQGDQDPRCCRQRPTVALRRPRSKNIAVDRVAVAMAHARPGRTARPRWRSNRSRARATAASSRCNSSVGEEPPGRRCRDSRHRSRRIGIQPGTRPCCACCRNRPRSLGVADIPRPHKPLVRSAGCRAARARRIGPSTSRRRSRRAQVPRR